MRPKVRPGEAPEILQEPIRFTAKGPAGPLRRFRRPIMTKATGKRSED